MSILVVDDDTTYGFLVKRAFAKEGLAEELEMAVTAAEAREVLSRRSFQVVLLDMNLPDASGLEVLAWIRQRSWVPVLMHSGSRHPEEVAAAYAGRANGYLEKQTSFERLRALVRNLHAYWVLQNRYPLTAI